MTAPLMSAVAVSRWYRRGSETVHAVDGVTLHLEPGVVYLLQGPSGSGKTTLLNVLAGWERPGEGHVEWRGERVDPRSLTWSDLAVVPQRVGLLPEMTAGENAALAPRIGGDRRFEATASLIALGLADLEDSFPDELSVGQQQRVAIARALGGGPAALLADEPTSSQDEDHARIVLGALRSAAASGSMCLIAGHDPIAEEYADAVIIMRDGSLVVS